MLQVKGLNRESVRNDGTRSPQIPCVYLPVGFTGQDSAVPVFPNGPYIFVNRHASRSRLGDDRDDDVVSACKLLTVSRVGLIRKGAKQ